MAAMQAAPVPVTGHLKYTRQQAEQLGAPHASTAEIRPLLRQFHDELLASLAPRLAAMRADGLVVDHASSWLLGEFVAHVDPERAAEAEARLRDCPELKDVGRAQAVLRKTKRR